VIQGIDKLTLFLGHLRLQDRTGQLVHIDLCLLQLLSGGGAFCLNQPFNLFTWVETGWLQSLWEFVSETYLTINYSLQWIPLSPRENDQFIMDMFRERQLHGKIMEILNRCRLYLQVITLSDIVTDDG